jgi:hypothetical protein
MGDVEPAASSTVRSWTPCWPQSLFLVPKLLYLVFLLLLLTPCQQQIFWTLSVTVFLALRFDPPLTIQQWPLFFLRTYLMTFSLFALSMCAGMLLSHL